MIRRSVAVTIALTFQRLIEGKAFSWTFDQELVLQALRRSNSSLTDSTVEDLGEYLRSYDEDQLRGVLSNVKGIYHELLIEHLENTDGDEINARLFEETNYPGAEVEFVTEGDVIHEVQVKAVQDPAAIVEHFARYPEIDVLATTEVYEELNGVFGDRLQSSGFSNLEISQSARETFEQLEQIGGDELGELIQDGVITSIVLTGALQAKAILSGQPIEAQNVRSILEIMGIGAGAALTFEALLNIA
ncbi:MAG: hypothetical protein ACR2O2_03200 [Ruegeria sp.]